MKLTPASAISSLPFIGAMNEEQLGKLAHYLGAYVIAERVVDVVPGELLFYELESNSEDYRNGTGMDCIVAGLLDYP